MAASSLLRPCLHCGEPTNRGSRCPSHRRNATGKPSPQQRGYDAAWRRLSRQARSRQPWCSTCGTGERLTVDHSPGAWQKIADGHRLSLADFTAGLLAVECIRCNVAKGHARGAAVERTD